MASTKFNPNLSLIRSIFHLLREQLKGKVTESPIYDVIKQTIRQNQITDRRICRAENELKFLGQCYYTYLNSGKKYRFLLEKYYNKPERSVEKTAEMMGFKLPQKQ